MSHQMNQTIAYNKIITHSFSGRKMAIHFSHTEISVIRVCLFSSQIIISIMSFMFLILFATTTSYRYNTIFIGWHRYGKYPGSTIERECSIPWQKEKSLFVWNNAHRSLKKMFVLSLLSFLRSIAEFLIWPNNSSVKTTHNRAISKVTKSTVSTWKSR